MNLDIISKKTIIRRLLVLVIGSYILLMRRGSTPEAKAVQSVQAAATMADMIIAPPQYLKVQIDIFTTLTQKPSEESHTLGYYVLIELLLSSPSQFMVI